MRAQNPGSGQIDKAHIEKALGLIEIPGGGDLVSAGYISDIAIDGSQVRVVMEVPADQAERLKPASSAAETALRAVPGVVSATVLMTAHYAAGQASKSAAPSAPSLKPLPKAPVNDGPVEGVRNLIAVGSGKGGVGKSTVTSNLAVALAQAGRKVGLLDADVYGPSQPRMMGASGRPASPDGKLIEPLHAHGVTLMSLGFLTDEDKATIWRGPMLMGALQQMLRQVAWGELDVLLIDLPPGTGDVQLTLAQKAKVTGAIVVSTPQDVALLDAKKAIDMFQRTHVPLLGMIENMSSFVCPKCGEETQIFGHGGAQAEAERLGIPFLGALPLDIEVRLAGDLGTPVVLRKPQSVNAERFRAIADGLVAAGVA
ncbi:MAG: Mrp/NBP35 family ATP-binding protein [Neomegalonema sp.]|nr:Mrp/NBP35 family ATP-binding protein [Neomegalonema sp.]